MSKKGNGSNKGNDQRSNSKNYNNPTQKAAGDNRANQLNPNHSDSKQVKK